MKTILSLLTITVLLCASSIATACSWPEKPSLGVVVWPIPDNGWNNGDEIPPAPTDTQIWFSVSHIGNAWSFSLQDPDGQDIPVEVTSLPDNGRSSGGTWVTAKPLDGLRPNTTYTAAVEFESSSDTWTFTTGSGPSQDAPPTLENLRYFIIDREVDESDCGGTRSDRQYFALVDKPIASQPYLYQIDLHFEDDPKEITARSIFYDWGVGPRPQGMASAATLGRDGAPPCMTLHVTDVTGQTVSSEPRCIPSGCLDEFPE